jgi:hypothetical protein
MEEVALQRGRGTTFHESQRSQIRFHKLMEKNQVTAWWAEANCLTTLARAFHNTKKPVSVTANHTSIRQILHFKLATESFRLNSIGHRPSSSPELDAKGRPFLSRGPEARSSKNCQNDELFDRKAGIQIAKRAGS